MGVLRTRSWCWPPVRRCRKTKSWPCSRREPRRPVSRIRKPRHLAPCNCSSRNSVADASVSGNSSVPCWNCWIASISASRRKTHIRANRIRPPRSRSPTAGFYPREWAVKGIHGSWRSGGWDFTDERSARHFPVPANGHHRHGPDAGGHHRRSGQEWARLAADDGRAAWARPIVACLASSCWRRGLHFAPAS